MLLNRDQEGAGDAKPIALDAATGKTRWETPRDENSTWNTPLVVTHDGTTPFPRGHDHLPAIEPKESTGQS